MDPSDRLTASEEGVMEAEEERDLMAVVDAIIAGMADANLRAVVQAVEIRERELERERRHDSRDPLPVGGGIQVLWPWRRPR